MTTFYVKLYLAGGTTVVYKQDALHGQQVEVVVEQEIAKMIVEEEVGRGGKLRFTNREDRLVRILVVAASNVVAFEYASGLFGFEESEVYDKAEPRDYLPHV